jgi:hypothetical protein
MFMTYLKTEFHMPSFNGSPEIATKLIAKGDFCMTTTLLFHTLQEEITVTHFSKILFQV